MILSWVKTIEFVWIIWVFFEHPRYESLEVLKVLNLALFTTLLRWQLKIHQLDFAIKADPDVWREKTAMRYSHVIKKGVGLKELLNHFIKIFRVLSKISYLSLEGFGEKLQHSIIKRWRVKIFIDSPRVLFQLRKHLLKIKKAKHWIGEGQGVNPKNVNFVIGLLVARPHLSMQTLPIWFSLTEGNLISAYFLFETFLHSDRGVREFKYNLVSTQWMQSYD